MISTKNLLVCLFYGLLSTCQTLNSRYLFRTIGFDYYSFVTFYHEEGIFRLEIDEYCVVYGHMEDQVQIRCYKNNNSVFNNYVHDQYFIILLCDSFTTCSFYGIQKIHCFFHIDYRSHIQSSSQVQ
jgi:hypothetical protein